MRSMRSMSYASSLKSHPLSPQRHRYYEATESIPSTAASVAPLPSTNLNPPKIVQSWYTKPILWIRIISICLLITLFIVALTNKDKMTQIFNFYVNIMKTDHSWGIVLFSIMLFISILLMLPQTIFIINGCQMIIHIWGKTKGIFITISIIWTVNCIASIRS